MQNPQWSLQPIPGEICMDSTAVSPAVIQPTTDAHGNQGTSATWQLRDGAYLDVTQIAVAIGSDLLAGRSQITTSIRNVDTVPVRLGVRNIWLPRISARVTAANPAGTGAALKFFVALGHDARPDEPFGRNELELFHSVASSWHLSIDQEPSINSRRYTVAGTLSGPEELDPPPTLPELFQYTYANHFAGVEALGGVCDSCFFWRIPDPPRDAFDSHTQMAIVMTWGATEATAIELQPGESYSATQYLYAYREYPLSADAGPDQSVPCTGVSTTFSLSGIASPLVPTSETITFHWTASDPAITFTAPRAAATDALASGPGEYDIALRAVAGVYEAKDTVHVSVTDSDPPRAHAIARPGTLWPPNHQLVPVHVALTASDDCDAAPSVRLVSITSNERDVSRGCGDGNTTGDIQDAAIGTDDRDVLLRAERCGRGSGRTYLLTYEVQDASGNVATVTVPVLVGHDRRPPRPARP